MASVFFFFCFLFPPDFLLTPAYFFALGRLYFDVDISAWELDWWLRAQGRGSVKPHRRRGWDGSGVVNDKGVRYDLTRIALRKCIECYRPKHFGTVQGVQVFTWECIGKIPPLFSVPVIYKYPPGTLEP